MQSFMLLHSAVMRQRTRGAAVNAGMAQQSCTSWTGVISSQQSLKLVIVRENLTDYLH